MIALIVSNIDSATEVTHIITAVPTRTKQWLPCYIRDSIRVSL